MRLLDGQIRSGVSLERRYRSPSEAVIEDSYLARLEGAGHEEDHVVDGVRHHGSEDTVAEHQPEEQHAHEPGVDVPQESEVLVRVTEVSGGADDGCTENPVSGEQLRCERAERQPVRHRDEQVREEPVHQAEGDPVEEGQHDHRGAEEQPAIDQLLPDAGVDGVLDGTPDEGRLVLEVGASLADEGEESCPDKDEPDCPESAGVEPPDGVERHREVLTPDGGENQERDEGADELRHVVGEKCPRGDLKRVGVGLIAHENPFGRDEKNAQSVV